MTNSAQAIGKHRIRENKYKQVYSNKATATVTVTQTPPPDTQIPEFPSIALPVAAIIGLIFISQRRKEK